MFNDVAKALSKSFQVVLIDLRGHGYSDKPRHIEFHEFADDVKALLDYIYIDQAAYIGHEMGAIVASDVAVRYPDYVSSLTLVNPTSIEVNYLKNVCLESMPIRLEIGTMKNKINS